MGDNLYIDGNNQQLKKHVEKEITFISSCSITF
jgi:hypothetical protein